MYLENNILKEDYPNELQELFKEADKNSGYIVQVIFEIDTRTHETIEIDRTNIKRTKDDESNPKRSI